MCADPRGAKKRSCISMAFCMVISALVFVFARPLMAILVDAGETEVILDGVRYLRIEGACDCGPLSVIFSNGDISPQNTFKTGINAP